MQANPAKKPIGLDQLRFVDNPFRTLAAGDGARKENLRATVLSVHITEAKERVEPIRRAARAERRAPSRWISMGRPALSIRMVFVFDWGLVRAMRITHHDRTDGIGTVRPSDPFTAAWRSDAARSANSTAIPAPQICAPESSVAMSPSRFAIRFDGPVRRRLSLAMANPSSHTSLLAANLSSTFSCFLGSHRQLPTLDERTLNTL